MNIDDIVEGIESDIASRRGIGDEWEQIGDDIKDEIRAEWRSIVENSLNQRNHSNELKEL